MTLSEDLLKKLHDVHDFHVQIGEVTQHGVEVSLYAHLRGVETNDAGAEVTYTRVIPVARRYVRRGGLSHAGFEACVSSAYTALDQAGVEVLVTIGLAKL